MTKARIFTSASMIAIATALGATTFVPSAAYADALLAGTITSAAGEKMGGVTVSAKAGRRDHHHQRLHRRDRQLLFPAAGGGQISGLGAGADLSDRQGKCGPE